MAAKSEPFKFFDFIYKQFDIYIYTIKRYGLPAHTKAGIGHSR